MASCTITEGCLFLDGHEMPCETGDTVIQPHGIFRHMMTETTVSDDLFDKVWPSSQADDIIGRLIPEWQQMFVRKNAKYKRVGNELGPRGVYPDLHRKMGIIRLAVWEGERLPEGSEPVREVIMDEIGHLFLMLHMLDQESHHEA